MMMVKLIGFKRIVILAVLFGINLLVLGGYFFVLDPALEELSMQVKASDAQNAELSRKISETKQEMAYLKENMPKYQELKDKGLFQDQNRFLIARLLDGLHAKASLFGFSFSVDPLKELPNTDAANIGYKVADSTINIKIDKSPLDNSIYSLLQDIPASFPGHTHIKSFSIKRTGSVTADSLKAITNGKETGFVSANFSFEWMTLLPKDDTQPGSGGAAGSAAPDGFRGR